MIRLCSCCRPVSLSPFSQWTGKGEFTKEDFVQMMVRQTQTSEAELIKESFKVSHWVGRPTNCSLRPPPNTLSHPPARPCTQIIDSEKTAFIDAEALKNALSSAGVEGFSDDDIAAAIRQASSGGDKTKIDLEEFTKLWAEVKP